MSKKSSRYSNPNKRESKFLWDNDKRIHQAKLEHQKQTLVKLGLAPKIKENDKIENTENKENA